MSQHFSSAVKKKISCSIHFDRVGQVTRTLSHLRCQQLEGPAAGQRVVRKRYCGPETQRGHKKEHGWVLVSKSLTIPPAPPRAGEVI